LRRYGAACIEHKSIAISSWNNSLLIATVVELHVKGPTNIMNTPNIPGSRIYKSKTELGRSPFVLQAPQNVAKSTNDNNNQLYGNFQPVACLSGATRTI